MKYGLNGQLGAALYGSLFALEHTEYTPISGMWSVEYVHTGVSEAVWKSAAKKSSLIEPGANSCCSWNTCLESSRQWFISTTALDVKGMYLPPLITRCFSLTFSVNV